MPHLLSHCSQLRGLKTSNKMHQKLDEKTLANPV